MVRIVFDIYMNRACLTYSLIILVSHTNHQLRENVVSPGQTKPGLSRSFIEKTLHKYSESEMTT